MPKGQQQPSCGGSERGVLDQVGLEGGKIQKESGGVQEALLTPQLSSGPGGSKEALGALLSPWACRKGPPPFPGAEVLPCLSPTPPFTPTAARGCPQDPQLCPRARGLALTAVLGWGEVLATLKCLFPGP